MGALWGLQFAMLKLAAAGGYPDHVVLMVALLLLSLIFTGISLAVGQPPRLSVSLMPFFVVTSLLGYVFPLLAVLFAASELSAGLLTLIACMAPVVAISLALFLRTEHVSPPRIAAVLLGVVSVAMILIPETELPNWGKSVWILAALIVPLAYGIESVYVAARWPKGLSALQAVTGETLVAALIVAPIVMIGSGPWPSAFSWTNAEVAILVFVGAGVAESLIYFSLIQKTGGVFVNFGTFVSLFAGIAWGIVLFGEVHSAMTWAAVAVLAAALFIASRRSRSIDRE
jgi:drug/metabolite transporter (DMT)-like permease